MPRIIVSTDPGDGRPTHTEWVTPDDFESPHFRAQLAERLAWAVQDASHAAAEAPPAPAPDREARWSRDAVRV